MVTGTARHIHNAWGRLLASQCRLYATQDAATPDINRLQIDQQHKQNDAAEYDLGPEHVDAA